MILTTKQQEGLEIACSRYSSGEKYTVIAGFAGTGKSTLVQHIIQSLNIQSSEVVYTAYTGKATLVLSQKGCENTSTLHKLLYFAVRDKNTGKYSFKPRPTIPSEYKIVVIDEVSMLPKTMWDLLLKHHVHILALGDPGQLGPIKATEGTNLLDSPHIFLDEIVRQAQDNEIIKLSMDVRDGKSLEEQAGEDVMVVPSKDLSIGMLFWADQVLCATNATRHSLNKQMREVKGMPADPQIGDKIICLKNDWDTLSKENETPLTNGTIGYITEIEKVFNPKLNFTILKISFKTELGDTFSDIIIDYKLIMENTPSVTKANYRTLASKPATKALLPKEFAFGYAITTWKSQGSEWDKVLLIEEAFPFKKEEHKQYLYTGITRASQKVVVIKK